MRGRATRSGLLVATAALAWAALMGAPAHAADSGGVTIPPFYDPPRDLPAHDGDLVRTERVRLAVSLRMPGMRGRIPAEATRIMYRSTDTAGRAVAVTGTYLEPTDAWTGRGRRPLVAFAPGTQGQGDQCAPSLALERDLIITPTTLQLDYEGPGIYDLVDRGVAVVVTDYVGLGTTDRLHTYVARVDEAHAVLDAARAARRLPGASVGRRSRVAAYGYSQGGGAAAAAAELQPAYAPDVRLVAAYAGAPPADLAAVLGSVDGSALAGAVGWAVNSLAQAYPAIRPAVDAHVSAAGRAALRRLETMCTADAIAAFAFRRSSDWTADGRPLERIVAADPAIRAVIEDQRIGRRTPRVAVRIVTGTQDDFVDHAQARRLAADWCARGVPVTYQPVRQAASSGGLGLNHALPLLADGATARAWIVARLRGAPAPGNCGALPRLP